MDLGRRLKQERLDAGLSQRQLCGTEITRNMLSQIENGNARPSMDTLRYLAARLNRPVSYFLEENAVVSPNQTVMAQARAAWKAGHIGEAQQALKEYRPPDPVFDLEKELLETLTTLWAARDAMAGGRQRYAAELLEKLGKRENGYCAAELERERLLLLAKVRPTLRRCAGRCPGWTMSVACGQRTRWNGGIPPGARRCWTRRKNRKTRSGIFSGERSIWPGINTHRRLNAITGRKKHTRIGRLPAWSSVTGNWRIINRLISTPASRKNDAPG